MYHSVGNVDDGGGYARVGAWSIWEISVPSSRFGFEAKTALKKKKIENK